MNSTAIESPPRHSSSSTVTSSTPDTISTATGVSITIQNIVCTYNLGIRLDLKQIAMKVRNAEYNPKRFSAVILKIRSPKATALVFGSGKLICMGTKSEVDSKRAVRYFKAILKKIGFTSSEATYTINNMVGTCDVSFPIRLEGICCEFTSDATYEPEIFPGLIYRMKEPKIVVLIFVSGKIVLTGAKSEEDIRNGFNKIRPILDRYRK